MLLISELMLEMCTLLKAEFHPLNACSHYEEAFITLEHNKIQK